MNNKNKHIILFDGICNLCNSSIQFILKKDTQDKFVFASLQSDAAKNILLQKNYKKFNQFDLNTIYLVKDNKIYNKSTAILLILKELKLPFKLLYVFIITPKFIRDTLYRFISKNRYRWFGKRETCMIPNEKYTKKFLS